MVTAIVGTILLLLCAAVVVGVAKDRGPSPEDVAVSYEHAWDRLDFTALYTLSARELRDGLDRKAFVATKRTAYAARTELGGLAASVTVDESTVRGDNAVATTRVQLRDGSIVHDTVQLVRRDARWQVAGYIVAPGSSTPSRGTE
jgi:hypothetical protein